MLALARDLWRIEAFRVFYLPLAAYLLATAVIVFLIGLNTAHATWKPDPLHPTPQAVQDWFRAQQLATQSAMDRLHIKMCCHDAERLVTKFVGTKEGEWAYFIDPNCTNSGCPSNQIPNDVIHDEEIHALTKADDGLPEFEAMRREGVLMIFLGRPSCFWPPEPSI